MDISFERELMEQRNLAEQKLREAHVYIRELQRRILELEKQLEAEKEDR